MAGDREANEPEIGALAPARAGGLDAAMPAVSVIMVFHRDTPYLRPAIASVLGQTWRDLELVLVDNGCGLPDGELGEAGREPRVRRVRLARDDGIGVAANAGLAAARGEFIAIADSDDLSLPSRLEQQVAALRADAGLGLVSAWADRIDEAGRPLGGRIFTLREPGEFPAYAQYAAPLVHPVATGRREVFAATPFRPPFRYTSELDFYARATERWRMAVLPEVLLRYRFYSTQTTQRHAANIEQSRCAINLLTARRRAGRPEELDGMDWMSEAVPAAEYCRRTAAQCLAEGFAVPAAYLARRSLVLERSPISVVGAARLAARAWRLAPARERRRVAAMFLTGPVRALNLRPA